MNLDELAAEIGTALRRRGRTLALAESCTGGLVCHHITNIPGSSDYFLGGVVSYANGAKGNLLGVPADTLQVYGSVSRETAVAMAKGVRDLLGSDIALAVTGIAGPGGGTREKPVGLVHISLVTKDVQVCERHVWPGDRLANKEASARAALQLLYHYLTARAVPSKEQWSERRSPTESNTQQRLRFSAAKPLFITENACIKFLTISAARHDCQLTQGSLSLDIRLRHLG